jgi:hypothetical protein
MPRASGDRGGSELRVFEHRLGQRYLLQLWQRNGAAGLIETHNLPGFEGMVERANC